MPAALLSAFLAVAAAVAQDKPAPPQQPKPSTASTARAAPPTAQQQQIARLVKDLRSDDVRGNCQDAVRELMYLAKDAEPDLQRALKSDDWQQRQGAAYVLQWFEDVHVTDDLLKVSIEGLRNDNIPREPRPDGKEVHTEISNATSAVEFLAKHIDRAEPLLVPLLKADDLQQRFLAAVALGWSAKGASENDRIAAILIPHLKDNQIFGDAILAGGALFRMGRSITPKLSAALATTTDQQQSDLLRLIIRDIADPPKTGEDWAKRRGLVPSIPGCSDPVAEFRLGSQGLAVRTMDERMTEDARDKPWVRRKR